MVSNIIANKRFILQVIIFSVSAFFFVGLSYANSVNAYVDKNRIQLNDFFTLTIKSSSRSNNTPDFSSLNQNFEIISGPSKSSQTSIINGRFSNSTTWSLTLSAKAIGAFVIPPIKVGSTQTKPITIVVGTGQNKQQLSFINKEIGPHNLYERSSTLLHIKLYLHTTSISDLSISKPEANIANFVEMGEATQRETIYQGVRYVLIEQKYLITTNSSGKLKIKPIVASGIENIGGRNIGFFGHRGQQKRFRVQSKPIEKIVKAKPASFPQNQYWLASTEVSIHEEWSPKKANYFVGEAITRVITIKAKGIESSLLQPIKWSESEGLKIYPDSGNHQHFIENNELIAERSDTFVVVPNIVGNQSIAEIKIPWWDTKNERLRYASLPKKQLTIRIDPDQTKAIKTNKDEVKHIQSNTSKNPNNTNNKINLFLLGSSIVSFLLWLITLAALLVTTRRNKYQRGKPVVKQEQSDNIKLTQLYRKTQEKEIDINNLNQAIKEWLQLLIKSRIHEKIDIKNKVDKFKKNNAYQQLSVYLYGEQDNHSINTTNLILKLQNQCLQLEKELNNKTTCNSESVIPTFYPE